MQCRALATVKSGKQGSSKEETVRWRVETEEGEVVQKHWTKGVYGISEGLGVLIASALVIGWGVR